MRVKDRRLVYALSSRSRIVLNAPPGLNRSRERNLDVRGIVGRESAPGAGAVDSSPKLCPENFTDSRSEGVEMPAAADPRPQP